MKTFSIKEMETFCGIKAHTIRMWEHRYSILNPSRKKTARRFYSIEELEKALKLCLLNRNGYKISRLALMSDDEIVINLNRLFNVNALPDKAVDCLVSSMYRMNIEGFEAILDSCFLSWPANEVVQEVIYPFLQKVSLLFQGKQLTEEHLVVTVVRRKLIYSLEKIEIGKPNNRKVLLFLCGEQQLDLFLLYAACRLKAKGYTVINLGADVTFKNLSEVIALHQPQHLLTYCHKKQQKTTALLSALVKDDTCITRLTVVQAERKERSQQTAMKLAEVYYEDVWMRFEQD